MLRPQRRLFACSQVHSQLDQGLAYLTQRQLVETVDRPVQYDLVVGLEFQLASRHSAQSKRRKPSLLLLGSPRAWAVDRTSKNSGSRPKRSCVHHQGNTRAILYWYRVGFGCLVIAAAEV